MSQTTAELADAVRGRMQRQPGPLETAKPIASRFLAEVAERLPNIDQAAVAAVLLHASSYIGTEVLIALADEETRANRFHLLTANVMAVAGEQLFNAAAAKDPTR